MIFVGERCENLWIDKKKSRCSNLTWRNTGATPFLYFLLSTTSLPPFSLPSPSGIRWGTNGKTPISAPCKIVRISPTSLHTYFTNHTFFFFFTLLQLPASCEVNLWSHPISPHTASIPKKPLLAPSPPPIQLSKKERKKKKVRNLTSLNMYNTK